jgi:hypothetical protein
MRALHDRVGKLEVLWDAVIKKLAEAEPIPPEVPTYVKALAQKVRALDEQLGKLESLLDAVIKKLAE